MCFLRICDCAEQLAAIFEQTDLFRAQLIVTARKSEQEVSLARWSLSQTNLTRCGQTTEKIQAKELGG